MHKDEIVELCRHHRIQRLEIFGSAARGDDFDPEYGDVDFLVEFAPDSDYPALAEYFDFNEALAKLLGRPVDFVMVGAVRNPYVLASINKSRGPIYVE
jgi:predicted nucleotidyltransferase